MVAGCGMTCIKYIVFAVNFLFFLLGAAAVGLGIYALVDNKDMKALTNIDSDGTLDDFNAVGLLQKGAIVLIVGGGCLLIIGFLGCCGAVKEVKCLLATYAGLIILILIIQIAAGAVAIAFRSRVEDYFQEGLIKGVKKYYDGNLTSDDAFSRAFDWAQVKFECCGVKNSTEDFVGSPWFDEKGDAKVPVTCCVLKSRDDFFDHNKAEPLDSNCPKTEPGPGNPNTNKPCYDSIRDWVSDRAAIIIGIAFGIVFVEIFAVVFACCLYRAIE
ncbi:tetraspanin-8-like [Babylonia areolata]|uniref:tetraspanin-8-like n=1 Tax=Babylonia areolata TaxID=304850 RepID=UPI003FD32457